MKLYAIYHLIWRGKVIYVGRSLHPKARLNCFEHKHGFRPQQKIAGWYENFETARKQELFAIDEFKPKYNRYRASSPGNLGQPQSARQKEITRKVHINKPLTVEHRQKLALHNQQRFADPIKLEAHYNTMRTAIWKRNHREGVRRAKQNPIFKEAHRAAVIAW